MRAPTLAHAGAIPVRVHVPEHAGRAAVIFMHGLRSDAGTLDHDARALTAAGITVLAPDAPHHGARRDAFLETMPDTGTVEGYRRLLAIVRAWRDEVPALVDHALRTHDAVAVAGISLGGFVALAAATVEPRVAVIASVLGSPDWTPHQGEAARHVELFADALAQAPCHRAEAFPPRPLVMLNGAHDENVLPGPPRALATRLAPLYPGDLLLHREYDSGHFAPPHVWREMVSTLAAFVGTHLPR